MDYFFKYIVLPVQKRPKANTGYTAENLGLFRRMAMNVIKAFDPNRGFADARRSAAFEPAYLRGLLAKLFAGGC
ncbi:MAG: hypothetical protein AAF443_06115 [Chlamydiota bacterium]